MLRFTNTFLLFAIALILFACNQAETSDVSDADTIAMEVEGYTDEQRDCLNSANKICDVGLSIASIGEVFEQIEISNSEGVDITDSLAVMANADGESFRWKVKRIKMEDGDIYLEGEAFGSSDSEELMANAMLSRIRVENPNFSTAKGVRVGMTIGELYAQLPQAHFNVLPIASFKAIDLVDPQDEHIHYLIDDYDGSITADMMNDPQNASLPEAAIISAIVVM
jgi:hypothetical protein